MFEIKSIRADHKDIIHDVAYDYYGRRMATCSSDQTVKIWDQDEQGQWTVSASWKAHSGSIWRLSWAHPEFGQILATCSFDRTASVWEEIVCEKVAATSAPVKRWARRTNLVDSRTSVTDIEFAPKHLGLLLATASADGIIRIYEAPDIMNLSQWSVQHEISCKIPLNCISWNKSMFRLHPPMIAAGSDETLTNTGKVFIFEYSENARKWGKTETISSVTDPVHDIAFAPSCGRSFHILAVASKDLYIFHIKPILDHGGNCLDIQQAGHFVDHGCAVWRVCWNVTGTMLSSTGDDNHICIWKMNYLRNWKCVNTLRSDDELSPADSNMQQFCVIPSPTIPQSAKYFKRGVISSPTQQKH